MNSETQPLSSQPQETKGNNDSNAANGVALEPFVPTRIISHGVTPEEQVGFLIQQAEREDVDEPYANWCRWLSQIDPREYMKGGSITPGKLVSLKKRYLQEHKLSPFNQT